MLKAIKNKTIALVAIGLFASVFIIYNKTLHYDFVKFDDQRYVAANPYVQRGLNWQNIKWAFTTSYFTNWHPLTWLSYITEFHLFGANGPVYHFNNVLLHAVNSVLLFIVFWLMLRQCFGENDPNNTALWGSTFIAVFFAVHPLRVESVAWISERKDVLSGMFWLLAMLFYFFYTKKPNRKRYIPVFICALLGLMSKPVVVTLPCALLLLDYWPLRRISIGPGMIKKISILIAEKLPLFALSIMSAIITLRVTTVVVSLHSLPLSRRLGNSMFAYGCYVGKILWPNKLAPFYPYDLEISWWKILSVIAVLLLITTIAIVYYRKNPWLVVGWLWFVGIMLPVSGLFQAGSQLMADRYTYIPSIGIALILFGAITLLLEKIPKIKKIVGLAVILVLIYFSFATRQQIEYWRDTPTLFRYTLQVTTKNYLAHYNLAHAVMFQPGHSQEAIHHFKKSAELNFRKSDCYGNIGIIHYNNNRDSEAIANFRMAIHHNDKHSLAFYNLGMTLSRCRQYPSAVKYFKKSLELKFKVADCHNNIGSIYYRTGKYDQAISHYQKAIVAQPKHHMAYCNLGSVYRAKGDYQKALDTYSQALFLHPNYFNALFFKGISLSALGRCDEAQNIFQKILQKSPRHEQVLFQSGLTYAKVGKMDEAKKQYIILYQLKSSKAQELKDFIEK